MTVDVEFGGRLAGGVHILPVRVYYEDTDFSGVVYHGGYIRFLERGRTELLRALGIAHDALDKGEHGERLAFAVTRLAVEFLKPARIDDIVEVTTRTVELTGARGLLGQSIQCGADMLLTAEVTVALVNSVGKPRRWPDAIRQALMPNG